MSQTTLWGGPDTRAVDDAEWLAQVRKDAARWWANAEAVHRSPVGHPLVLWRHQEGIPPVTSWYVHHKASMAMVGSPWQTEDGAKLWLWLALGMASWHLLPDVPTAQLRTLVTELDAAEARLRRALAVQP